MRARPCRAISSEFNCLYRGHEFDPGRPHTFVEIYCEIFSTVILLLPLIKEGLLSVTSEGMCTEYWLTAQSELTQEKK